MSSSTVYDVKVRYSLEDKATRGAQTMAREFDRANQKAGSLRGAIAGLGLAAGFMAGKRALIDFNSQIDQMRIGMTTILNMQLKKPWEEARKSADGLFFRFQELAKKSPATTKDFIEMANAITPMIASMGGGVDKIEKLTQGAVLAGIATGTRADVAANDVKSMLNGTVTIKDMMAQQLIAAQGMSKEDFNALSGGQRAAMTEKMFSHPSLLKAADEFGASFAGQVSTFQDQLQIALGSVGKPLMASMTQEVAKWNTWIEKHPRTIAKIAKDLGSMIKNSFEFIGKTVGWLVEHRDLIFAIGKTFLVFKGAQIATNAFAGFANAISGFTNTLRNGATSLMGTIAGTGGGMSLTGGFRGLISVLSGAGGAIPALFGLATAASQLWGLFTDINNDENAKATRMNFTEALGKAGEAATSAQELLRIFSPTDPRGIGMAPADQLAPDVRARKQQELANARATLSDPEVMGTFLRGISDAREKAGMASFKDLSSSDLATLGQTGVSSTEFAKLFADNADAKGLLKEMELTYRAFGSASEELKKAAYMIAFPEQFPDAPKKDFVGPIDYAEGWKNPDSGKTSDVKVTIQKIEVASDDPDRFVFGLVKAVKQIQSNPTQAASALAD